VRRERNGSSNRGNVMPAPGVVWMLMGPADVGRNGKTPLQPVIGSV